MSKLSATSKPKLTGAEILRMVAAAAIFFGALRLYAAAAKVLAAPDAVSTGTVAFGFAFALAVALVGYAVLKIAAAVESREP
jgi:hypothetical protein